MITIEEITENFQYLDNWEDRYEYLIDLGNSLSKIEDSFKTEEYRIKGCMSKVWLYISVENSIISLKGDSDSKIIKGLIYIIFSIYQNRNVKDAIELNPIEILKNLNLDEQISVNRNNGVVNMIAEISKKIRRNN